MQAPFPPPLGTVQCRAVRTTRNKARRVPAVFGLRRPSRAGQGVMRVLAWGAHVRSFLPVCSALCCVVCVAVRWCVCGPVQQSPQFGNVRYSKYNTTSGVRDGRIILPCLGTPPADMSLNFTGVLTSTLSMAECVPVHGCLCMCVCAFTRTRELCVCNVHARKGLHSTVVFWLLICMCACARERRGEGYWGG